MTDLSFTWRTPRSFSARSATKSGELDVVQIEGNTDGGAEFVDAWYQPEMTVVDAGRILVPAATAPNVAQAANASGLTCDFDRVDAERGLPS